MFRVQLKPKLLIPANIRRMKQSQNVSSEIEAEIAHSCVQLLTQFHHETVSADKVVLVTAGAPLNVAQSLGNDYLGGLVPSANTVAPISKYMGGGDISACSAGAHVVIAFEVAGWNDVKGSVMATVMQVRRQ